MFGKVLCISWGCEVSSALLNSVLIIAHLKGFHSILKQKAQKILVVFNIRYLNGIVEGNQIWLMGSLSVPVCQRGQTEATFPVSWPPYGTLWPCSIRANCFKKKEKQEDNSQYFGLKVCAEIRLLSQPAYILYYHMFCLYRKSKELAFFHKTGFFLQKYLLSFVYLFTTTFI